MKTKDKVLIANALIFLYLPQVLASSNLDMQIDSHSFICNEESSSLFCIERAPEIPKYYDHFLKEDEETSYINKFYEDNKIPLLLRKGYGITTDGFIDLLMLRPIERIVRWKPPLLSIEVCRTFLHYIEFLPRDIDTLHSTMEEMGLRVEENFTTYSIVNRLIEGIRSRDVFIKQLLTESQECVFHLAMKNCKQIQNKQLEELRSIIEFGRRVIVDEREIHKKNIALMEENMELMRRRIKSLEKEIKKSRAVILEIMEQRKIKSSFAEDFLDDMCRVLMSDLKES